MYMKEIINYTIRQITSADMVFEISYNSFSETFS